MNATLIIITLVAGINSNTPESRVEFHVMPTMAACIGAKQAIDAATASQQAELREAFVTRTVTGPSGAITRITPPPLPVLSRITWCSRREPA